MGKRNFHLHNGKKGAALAVRVIPRSSRNELAEILHDGTLKVRLTSPANDPNLNRELIGFLSSILQVAADHLDVVAGENHLDKLVSILNLDAAAVHERILAQLS